MTENERILRDALIDILLAIQEMKWKYEGESRVLLDAAIVGAKEKLGELK